MNKLTISFDTPAGVHSFTVQNGTHAQFQAAVAGVDNTRVPSFATVSHNTHNTYNIDRDAWDSIVNAVSGNEVGLFTNGQIAARVVSRCMYAPMMAEPGSKIITAEQWRSLCGLADVSQGVDPAHMVEQLIKRFG